MFGSLIACLRIVKRLRGIRDAKRTEYTGHGALGLASTLSAAVPMNFKTLPKIDLHLHLDGAIRVRTIAELADELGVKLPTYDPKKLSRYVQVDRDCRSLTEFLKRFEVFYPILPFARTQERIAYELCEDCKLDNVIYFETRFAPALAASKRFSMEDAVVASLEGLRRGQRDFGIRCGLILCCYRSISLKENIKTVNLPPTYRGRSVIGIDLADD